MTKPARASEKETDPVKDKPSVIRETDDDARTLARTLLRGARFGTLAVLDPDTGFPNASRVLLANAPDGTPAILVSSLSAHTRALIVDPRCSLLTGEPGKGDPLAHPRLTIQAQAEVVERDSRMHGWLRARFLSRHPKAVLYIDFGDFKFMLIKPVSASLNGGFGKAYSLPGADLVIARTGWEVLADEESALLDAAKHELADAANLIARNKFRQSGSGWRISAIDGAGIDISAKEILFRLEIPFVDMSHARMFADIRKVACSIP